MSASEAVMVAPEQCATAPKTLASQHAAPATTSTTRLVLLAVLALAAATGAMFGAVVLGNQLTQELHPKGSSHLNSVTLVDSEDRAIATTAVESYVSLLDLPLLGTAELNKVDGITFSTINGIEHRKVTGYTVTTEPSVVEDSLVETPFLSLATSAPGTTVEVSVRDNKAWLSEVEGSSTTMTPIDTSSQRRLADGGSCLESGACLYSRDELLRLDAASRRLEEGSFFARADVAAYQVELSGDLMQYMPDVAAAREATLDGTYSEGGHRLRLRLQEAPDGVQVLFTNLTSGESKLVTSEGNFVFSATGRLVRCNSKQGFKNSEWLTVEGVADAIAFESVAVTHDAPAEGFIPFEPSVRECFALTTKQANLSTPEALERFPEVAGALQRSSKSDIQAMKDRLFKVESRRKLSAAAADGAAAAMARSEAQELVSLMTNSKSGRHMTAEELSHPDRKRVLQAARAKAHKPRELAVTITKFDLWVATRMADPLSVEDDYEGGIDPAGTDFEAVANAGLGDAEVSLDLSGWHGVRAVFAEWSGFHLFGESASGSSKAMSAGAQTSTLLLQQQYTGTCVGAFNTASEPLAEEVVVAACQSFSYTELQSPPPEVGAKFESHFSHCAFFFSSYKECKASKDRKGTWGFEESMATCGEPVITECKASVESALSAKSGGSVIMDSRIDSRIVAHPFLSSTIRRLKESGCPSHIQEVLQHEGADAFPKDLFEKYPACAPDCPTEVSNMITKYSRATKLSDEDTMMLADIMKRHPECSLQAQSSTGTCPVHLLDECADALVHYVELTTPIAVTIEDTCDGRRRLAKIELKSISDGSTTVDDLVVKATTAVSPTAFAAILYKTKIGGASPADAKYVVSFQGTKFSEPAMLEYTLKKEAVFVKIDGTPIVTTEGFALYVAETAPCISDLISANSLSIEYITGHSLGGAAATVFKQSGAPGTLVSFGAPPTTPLAYDPVAVKYEMVYPSKAVKGGAYPDKGDVPATYADPVVGGIRYFHKFDPVPGYYFGMMGWKHAPATAYLLYDADGECISGGPSLGSGYVEADYGGTGSVASVFGNLYGFLCTSYGVATGSWQVTADPGTYFSYTNAVNPMPCAEALVSATVEYMLTLPSVSAPAGTVPGTWTPYESFYECTSSYVASLEAYVGHYITSQMGIFDAQIADDEYGGAMWFYGFWGLWWIHSAYPNYDLDSTYGPQIYSPAALTTNDPAEELGDLIMGNLPAFVESAYVDGSFSTSELAEFLGEEELEALWSFPTPRPTPRPVSRMPSYCYRIQYYARRWPWRRSLYMRYYPQCF